MTVEDKIDNDFIYSKSNDPEVTHEGVRFAIVESHNLLRHEALVIDVEDILSMA